MVQIIIKWAYSDVQHFWESLTEDSDSRKNIDLYMYLYATKVIWSKNSLQIETKEVYY